MTPRASVEERLAAALRARADAVEATYQQERFVPSTTSRARQPMHAQAARSGTWGVWISGGLVAAVIIAVVLVVLVGGARSSGRPGAPAGGQVTSSDPVRHSTVRLPSDTARRREALTGRTGADSTGHHAAPGSISTTSGRPVTSSHPVRQAQSVLPGDAASSTVPLSWPSTGGSTGDRRQRTSIAPTSGAPPSDTGNLTTSNVSSQSRQARRAAHR